MPPDIDLKSRLKVKLMLKKVGLKEFRANLAKYLKKTSPLAIVRDGQTVGYFFPTSVETKTAELEGLRQAAQRLDALLQEQELSEEELVSEFRQLREKKHTDL